MYINPNNHFNTNTDKATEKLIALLLENGEQEDIQTGVAVIRPGQLCDFFFIVLSGCYRTYKHINDKEVIIGFSFTGDIDTAPYPFITRTHSTETIEAIIPGEIVKIYRSTLEALKLKHPEFTGFIETLLASYINILVTRYIEFKSYTAEESYHRLITRQPEAAKNIPLKYIASYLGISQERLSRIRNKALQLT